MWTDLTTSAQAISQATTSSGSSSMSTTKFSSTRSFRPAAIGSCERRRRPTRDAPAATKAPGALKPRSLLPHRVATSATSTRFLQRIERVEIASVESFCGVTYYVIDVYLEAVALEANNVDAISRIPTTRQRRKPVEMMAPATELGKRRQLRARKLDTSAARTPDFRVVRRFTSFEQLCTQLATVSRASLSNNHSGADNTASCASCPRLRRLVQPGFSHPRVFAKLCANVSLRKKVLARFLRRAIELSVSTRDSSDQRVHCSRCRVLPRLVDQFLRLDMGGTERTDPFRHL